MPEPTFSLNGVNPATGEVCEIQPRIVAGEKMISVGMMTLDADLLTVRKLAADVALRNPERAMLAYEVGSWVGESAVAIYNGLAANGHPEYNKLYCIDTWKGTPTDRNGEIAKLVGEDSLFQLFCFNTHYHFNKGIYPVKGDSVAVARSYKESQQADFIFLDAAHDYINFKADIQAWSRHLRQGATLCGHDYSNLFSDVVRAVREYADYTKQKLNVVPETAIWYFENWETQDD